MSDWIFVAIFLAMPCVGAWVARSRGRSAAGWFCLVLVFSFVGLLTLLALPRLRLTCPQCLSFYRRGATACASCGANLPEPVIADRLTPGVRYDRQCPHCTTPYREEDYRPDAEQIFCSWCKGELPWRRPRGPETKDL